MTDVGSDTLIGSLVILSVSSAFLRNMSRLKASQYKTPGMTQIQYINHGEIHALTLSPQKVQAPHYIILSLLWSHKVPAASNLIIHGKTII